MSEEYSDEELDGLLGMGGIGGEGGYPKPFPKDTIFKFFRELLALKNNEKVGNLSTSELGQLGVTTRGYLELSNYCRAENMSRVAEYLDTKAQIILATSLSKKGFLPQLFVTQVRKEQKIRTPTEMKGGWFNKQQPSNEGGQT